MTVVARDSIFFRPGWSWSAPKGRASSRFCLIRAALNPLPAAPEHPGEQRMGGRKRSGWNKARAHGGNQKQKKPLRNIQERGRDSICNSTSAHRAQDDGFGGGGARQRQQLLGLRQRENKLPTGREIKNFPMAQRNATEAQKLVKHIPRAGQQAVSWVKETRRHWALRHRGLGRTRKAGGGGWVGNKNQNYIVNALFKLEAEVGWIRTLLKEITLNPAFPQLHFSEGEPGERRKSKEE